jgi:hypothetical protein
VASLRELQRDVLGAVLGRGDAAAVGWVEGDLVAARGRLAIYRHHVFATLTAVLEAAFPVVCRLVDERFFAYAADRYIRRHPPSAPCLFEYGGTFPAFLSGFPPCRDLPYLADVARLEWALHRAFHAPDHVALEEAALRARAAEVSGRTVLVLDPSLSLVASGWPIGRIWQANQPESDPGATVDLGEGGVRLEVRRAGEVVAFRGLDAAVFAFRQALAEGSCLADGVGRAVAVDEGFDLAGALAALVQEGLLAGIVPAA